MTSESFGCYDVSRHRWGGLAAHERESSLALPTRAVPVTQVAPGVRRLDAMHEGRVLLGVVRGYSRWVGHSCSRQPLIRPGSEPASNRDLRAPAGAPEGARQGAVGSDL